jgi:hypothetical protein
MSIEITASELQAILDDIRLNHSSDELIARMLIPEDTEELPIAPLRPLRIMTNDITRSTLTNEFLDPLPRPTLVRTITGVTNDFPAPLPRPTLVRTITGVTNDFPAPLLPFQCATNDFPAPLLPFQCATNDFPAPLLPYQCATNDFPAPLPRPTLVRTITGVTNDFPAPLPRPTLVRTITGVTNDFPAPLLPYQCATNDFPAPLLPSQCVTNDSPEPNPLPDEELPCIASLQRPTLQRYTNNECRLSSLRRVADSDASILSTLIEPAFSGLPITAEEVEEIVQGFRKAF